jgi:tetratricopeptide (TPR) repeat protein
VGIQAMADRYTYVPLIGLFIMIAWSAPDILVGWRYRRVVLSISVGLLPLLLMIVTKLQVKHWQSGVKLFEHSLDVTFNNFVIHNNLGAVLAEQGKIQEAMAHFAEALRIKPDYAEAHNNLGGALARQGKIQEAMAHYTEALRIKPDYAKAHINLGLAYLMIGNKSSALEEYKILEKIDPDLANVLYHKILK